MYHKKGDAMKNTTLRITCVLFLSLVCAGLTAQNIPVNLNSGWNWISYPRSEVMSLAAAMSGFTPSPGDVIKGMGGSSMYQNGHWQGSLNVLVPGEGYMYYSIGGTTKSFVFGGSSADASAIPDAALDGEFTVDANGTKVRFSPGNLQCRIDPNKETEATVGLGTGTVTGVPYHTNYKYSLCQMIFKAGELSDAGLAPGTITSLAFESYSPNHFLRTGIQIWMSPTTLNTAPTTSILASTMVLVYSGSLTQQDGWTRVYLNTPFPWDGESNVMVMVVMNHGSYGASTNWQCSNSGFTSCSYKYNDTNSYTPMVNTYASMNTSANRPNVRFFGKGGLVWRFAPEQFESIKNGNGMASQTYTGWIDLFGWGTSGRSHGASCYQPWSTSTTNSDYNAYNNSSYNLFSQTGEADWGCNAISNGGDQPNQWRTLTKEEWNYLLFTRSTASGKRYAKARIYANNADQYGLILLPDNWSTSYYNLSNTNSASASFTSNTFEPSSWLPLEQHGAVFLPVGGYRYGTSVSNTENGYYYSSSVKDESDVWIYTVKSSESKSVTCPVVTAVMSDWFAKATRASARSVFRIWEAVPVSSRAKWTVRAVSRLLTEVSAIIRLAIRR